METCIIENDCHKGRIFYTHRFLKIGGMAHHTGPHEEEPVLVRRQRKQGENMGMSPGCSFHGNEWVRKGKQAKQS